MFLFDDMRYNIDMNFVRKIIVILLCFGLAGVQCVFLNAEETEEISNETNAAVLKGDLNDDRLVNTLDYILLSKHLDGSKVITDAGKLKAADLNDDGIVDAADKQRLKNIIYYGEVDNKNVNVASHDIHTENQKKFLANGYSSILTYKGGGDASKPITLTYDSSVIGDGSTYTIKVSESSDMSNAKTYRSTSRTVKIENAKVQTLYFWTVSNGSNTSDLQAYYVDDVPVRNLSTSTIGNARDFGGFETEDGMIVKQGMMYRGHMMEPGSYLSKNRDVLINDIGIQTEIDIKEKQSDSSIYYDTSELNRYPSKDFDHYLRRYMKFELYGGYLSADYTSIGTVFKIFHDLADESNYPVYIHCRIGADRTGLICFLINALCGVSLDDLYTDYVFTTYSGDSRTAGWIENDYVKQIQQSPGRNFAEKTKNLLLSIARKYAQKKGMDQESFANALGADIDAMVSILKMEKPSTKSYIPYPKAESTTILCDGSVQKLKLSDDYLFNVTGNKASAAGEYMATISLKDPETYSWANGSKSDYRISWKIVDERSAVAAPSVTNDIFVYNGEEQEYVFEEQPYYTVEGNKQTDAGEYEAIVSLRDKKKYMWEDGSNDDLVFLWNIEKAKIDTSQITFEDQTYIYDGTEKSLIYEGELPAGIKEITYSENKLKGYINKDESIEVTMSFVVENENYEQPEDKKTVLTITPLSAQTDLMFDVKEDEIIEGDLDTIEYGQPYTLPICHKESYRFIGWTALINGERVLIENEGVWNYGLDTSSLQLIPLFEDPEEKQSGVEESEEDILLSVHMEGEGIGRLVSCEGEFNEENCTELGLYMFGTSCSYRIDKEDTTKQYYLLIDDQVIPVLNYEENDENQ